MIKTKGDIERLGEKIRKESPNISNPTLVQLQEYRTSYKEALSDIFNIICLCAKRIRKETIVTYRIKRFESIIGKLERFPDMKFDRMWDIAGCRCILKNEKDIYRLKELLSEKVYIRKETDYIKNPRDTGCRSLHLYISKSKDDTKIIELQVRCREQHNWATLVEITDFIFDEKLKERNSNFELARFHKLLSNKVVLSIQDKHEILNTLKKYNYIEKLHSIFKRNYINVRKQWLQIESKVNHNFFLIVTQRDNAPRITSFTNFNEAEKEYFNTFKDNSSSNIVLTHLPRASYSQISIAYSNYILTVHQFTEDYNSLLENLIEESFQKKKLKLFSQTFSFYCKTRFNVIKNLKEESSAITEEYAGKQKSKKVKEWIKDINSQVDQMNSRWQRLGVTFRKKPENAMFFRFCVNRIAGYQSRRYNRKVRKLFKNN